MAIPASNPMGSPLAPFLSYWTAPDGWVHRRYDRPHEPGTARRGRLLFQTGRADMIEKYGDAIDHFRAQGWDVTAFDWRGQGGSGRLTGDGTGHIDRLDRLGEDLAAFYAGWVRPGEGPHVVLGHSMGGFATLSALAGGGIAPDAVVLVAPMLALRSPVGQWAGARFARWQVGRGDPLRPAWRRLETPAAAIARQKRLTHDLTRFADQQAFRQAQPELCLGSPSWHWVAEAFRATAALRDDPALARIATPVLMLVALADQLVDAGAAARVAQRLPQGELVAFGRGCAHEILREADPVRANAFAAIAAFLDRRAPVTSPRSEPDHRP
ncbi:alpha/beta fold hydrolase [Sphingomonas yabuuchiae]|uniref:Alpha/beta hydrolase n=1 Tax=Sphingomonas yabuuchiae TaxID=172044 RepID=A0AA40ZYN7_9SPHN|nr:alpha/beta hydrolase [Sphingomonas yabuuchiae]MBB4609964.1 lysophospholipase [Sphingomonas yabuuchiae]MBN3558454.1 alpha/beta hydrolase [Sphingomonas yabuuchiae]